MISGRTCSLKKRGIKYKVKADFLERQTHRSFKACGCNDFDYFLVEAGHFLRLRQECNPTVRGRKKYHCLINLISILMSQFPFFFGKLNVTHVINLHLTDYCS